MFSPTIAACAVCEGLRGADNALLTGFSEQREDIAANSELVVDTIGFCGCHGSALAHRRDKHRAIACILRDATDSVIDLLSNEKRTAERLLELFFASDRSCALCKLKDHQVAHWIQEVSLGAESRPSFPSLCFPHYRDVAYSLKSPLLPALAGAQLQRLECVAAGIGLVTDPPHANVSFSPIAVEALDWALRIVAGDAGSGFGNLYVEDGFDADARCPVCAEINRAEERWLEAVKTAANIGQDLWTVFPTCPAHVVACARLGDPRLAAMTTRYAAGVELTALRRGFASLSSDNENREIASKSVFYRRKNPGYILGQQRKMITRVPRCPACERLIAARERAVGERVQKLWDLRYRSTAEKADDLCLKHFALVYVLAPKNERRSALAAAQIERLRGLRNRLTPSGELPDPGAVTEWVLEALCSWRSAMPRQARYP